MTKQELLEAAALILEQEGWVIERFAYENCSSRLNHLAKRYRDWQNQVNQARAEGQEWPVPPDNS